MDIAKLGIKVREEHLCVISDLHLGNPIFLKNHSLRNFFQHLAGNGASLCINGDGMDLLQFSVPKLAQDTLSAFKSLKDFFHNGHSEIYYILGNHDIFMKSHLEEAGIFPVVSTLEVVSGDKLIHIEHGHFYDYLFQNYQKLYFRLARLLGKALRICPEFFHLYFKVARIIDRPVDEPELEAAHWRSGAQIFADLTDALRLSDAIVIVIVMIMMAASLAFTTMLNIMERTKEIATLAALGASPATVRALLVRESLVLALAASLAGLLGAGTLYLVTARYGIPIGNRELSGFLGSSHFYPAFEPAGYLAGIALPVFVAVTSSAFFAWRASRLSITAALADR